MLLPAGRTLEQAARYILVMKTGHCESSGKLIRVLADRRGQPVELRVHYEKLAVNGCDTYRLISIEDAE